MVRSAWLVVARRGWRRLRRPALGLAGVVAAYVALVVWPQPLFAHSLRRDNLVLHAREELGAEAGRLLEDVLGRVRRSPLYDAERVHHVYLCDTPALFGLLTLWNYRAGGVTNTWLNGNVFIRPASVKRGRVIGHSGVEKGGERTLAYYVAHEVTHAMTADRVGAWPYSWLAAFQVEGYADYVARGGDVDVARERRELRAGAKDMNPQLSGHYDRYRLLVGYLLQDRRLSVQQLLDARLERRDIEQQLLAASP